MEASYHVVVEIARSEEAGLFSHDGLRLIVFRTDDDTGHQEVADIIQHPLEEFDPPEAVLDIMTRFAPVTQWTFHLNYGHEEADVEDTTYYYDKVFSAGKYMTKEMWANAEKMLWCCVAHLRGHGVNLKTGYITEKALFDEDTSILNAMRHFDRERWAMSVIPSAMCEKKIKLRLSDKDVREIASLLMFHAPVGGGSPTFSLYRYVCRAARINADDLPPLGSIAQEAAAEHLASNEGDIDRTLAQYRMMLEKAAKSQ